MKNATYPGVTLVRSTIIGVQNRLCATSWCSPNCSRATISAMQRPKNAHSIYVYSDLAHSMLWVAGGNCISKNHYNRYRGTHQ